MYETPYHQSDLSNYHFLITGGAGFIGSHLTEYLLKYGAHVRVIDNFLTGNKENIQSFFANPKFEFIEGNICDYDLCQKAMAGIDFVSHQAALGSVPRSVKDPLNTNRHNIDGFVNVLFAAKEAGVKNFVYASSSSVYGDSKTLPKKEDEIGKPLSPYAVTKAANELYADVFVKTYNMKIIGLRYFNIFGPRQDPHGPYAAVIPIFVSKLMKNETVFIDGDGEQTRDFTFVENAVQANVKALLSTHEQANNQVYNIAVGERFSVNEMYQKICNELNISTNPTYRESRAGDIRNSLADISKAQKLLNYQPLFKFDAGLTITVDYFKNK